MQTGEIDESEWLPPDHPAIDRETLRLRGVEISESDDDRGGVQFRRRSFDDPIQFYDRKGSISYLQARAGRKLYQLWYYGCLTSPWVLMRYGEITGTGDPELSVLLYPEYRAAMSAIRGVPERRVAYNVCCMGEMVKELGREKSGRVRSFPSVRTAQREGMQQLRDALDDLVRHFRY